MGDKEVVDCEIDAIELTSIMNAPYHLLLLAAAAGAIVAGRTNEKATVVTASRGIEGGQGEKWSVPKLPSHC